MLAQDTRPEGAAPLAERPDAALPRLPARGSGGGATALATALAIAPLLALGWLEAGRSPGIPLVALYCVPIGLFAWFHGGRAGWLVVLAATGASLPYASRLEALHGSASMVVLHGAIDLALFAATHLSIDRLRSQIARLNASSDLYGRLAFRDRLTDLPNRHLLYDRLATAIATARRSGRKVALMFLDLDGFKPVNDRWGHKAGDRVLKSVAARLSAAVRRMDTVARIGGDEFAVLLCEVEGDAATEAVARKILAALAEPFDLGGGERAAIGASIGVSVFPEHGMEIDRLIAVADAAMYESKTQGRNRYTFAGASGREDAAQPWLQFTAAHEIGVSEIDRQHRQLVRIANRLNDAIRASEPVEHVAKLFDELVLYTRYHFATEERIMDRHHFPAREGHHLLHEYLLEEIAHVRERMAPGNELTVLQTVKDWLLDHIDSADRELGGYLAGRGVR